MGGWSKSPFPCLRVRLPDGEQLSDRSHDQVPPGRPSGWPGSPAELRGRCRDVKEFAGMHQEPWALFFCGEPEYLPLLNFFRMGVNSLKCT